MARLIAITGNIGSGKTHLINYLAELGYKTFSADIAVSKLYENKLIQNKILELLPTLKIFDKTQIAKIIFKNDFYCQQLEHFIHPLVNEALIIFKQTYQNENLLFAEMPLLFETDSAKRFDSIILTYCDDNTRLNRAMLRANFNLARYKIINDKQYRYNNVINFCNYALDTDNNESLFKAEVEIIIKDLNQR